MAIIAAGPSAKTAGVEKLKDRIHCIAVNESHKLCPWAEFLYSCDADWWKLRENEKEVKAFGGTKLMLEQPGKMFDGVSTIKIPQKNNIWVDDFLFDKPGVIGSGGHSGFQMMNLAAQFGATDMALVGFDMQPGGAIHWHGLHPSPLRNPDACRFDVWRRTLDTHAHKLAARGIDVVNCSPVSALTSFPKMTIDQMLERWGL